MGAMWRNVPRKNISTRIADVFRPRRKSVGEFVGAADDVRAERAPAPDMHGEFPERSFPMRRFVLVFAVVGILGVVLAGALAYQRKVDQLHRVAESLGGAQAILPGLRGYEGLLNDGSEGLSGVETSPLTKLMNGATSIGDMFTVAQALFADLGGTFTSAQAVSDRLGALFGHVERLRRDGLRMMLNDGGNELIAMLRAAREDLGGLNEALEELEQIPGPLKTFMPMSPGEYLDHRVAVNRAVNTLDAAIAWLDGKERHIAVFFLNPAELRPGGGFIGSYADVTLVNGSLRSLTVHDVNEPDRGLQRNIVPPRELQGLVKRWRAADANWSFDFPASAEKVLSFMDASELYPGDEPYFDAAVGVSAPVVRDILTKLGPLKLSPKQVITADNFLTEIQREVQLAQERGDDAPKLVLGELAPMILSIMRSEEFAWDEGPDVVAGWVIRKDLMAYVREPALQNFAETVGMAGQVFRASANDDVDYLAVAIANIGGGKSDLYTKQEVTLQSQLSADGVLSNHVIVKRMHQGTKAAEWWYRTPNQAFVKVFAPNGAKLEGGSGIIERSVTPLVNYAKGGYETDADLARLEATAKEVVAVPGVTQYEESGKTVFGAWMRTPLGETTELTMDYAVRKLTLPKDGGTHTFVLERQTGAFGKYRVELHAPVGYRWRENGLPVYEYETADLPARLVITLTLEQAL